MPYCQEEPQNDELKGLFQCQFASAANATAISSTSGNTGTVPFGLSAPVSPAGACPAHPEGPIPDGEQLVHITQDPGLANVPVDGVAPTLNGGREVLFALPLVGAGTTPSITRMNFCPPSNSSSSLERKSVAARKTPRRLNKRAGQDLAAATAPWAAACGGAPECSWLAAAGSAALRADADACAQQDAADAMVAHALATGGDDADVAEMIRLAQIYAQQPRNTVRPFPPPSKTSPKNPNLTRYTGTLSRACTQPTGLSTPYCQRAPRQPALTGLFACQFQSADPHAFAGGLISGDVGTRPFGLAAPLQPAGACAASPRGPVPDGLQLVDLVAEACAQA